VTQLTIVIVVVGVALAGAVGLAGGFDAASLLYFGIIVALGALAIAVARKSGTGAVGPRRCPQCGGLISPNAPYCKHCGADLPTA
jgi:hypothetical protein